MFEFDIVEGGEVVLDHFQPNHVHDGGQHQAWLESAEVVGGEFVDTLPQLPVLG